MSRKIDNYDDVYVMLFFIFATHIVCREYFTFFNDSQFRNIIIYIANYNLQPYFYFAS